MIIVLQGRLRSTRLPGKGFFTFFGQTIWERMCDIALAVDGVDEIVFATGHGQENELMRPLVEAKGVRFFAGSEDNVLERFCQSIDGYSGEYLVRLTCDNYLAQPAVIEAALAKTLEENADYAFVSPLSHYAGEIVRCTTLRDCHDGDFSDNAREHVTWDIRANDETKVLELPADFLGLDHSNSPTLDTVEDFVKMKAIEGTSQSLAEIRCINAIQAYQDVN